MSGAGPLVLVVDDSPTNLRLVRASLAGEGYEIATAASGEEALACARERRPALVLLDIELPGLSGFEVARRLKASGGREIKVILVSGRTDNASRARAAAIGCEGFVSKPLDPIALAVDVAHQLGRTPPSQPAVEPASERPSAAASPVPTVTPAANILVVEDNPTTRKMVRVALESHGYAVSEAADCRTAIERAMQQRPDLVLQDLVLPDMDGFELLRRLRELPGGLDLPILCLSGFVSRIEEARDMKGGFAAVLVKPVDPIQLLEMVRIHLERPASTRSELGRGHRVLVIDDEPLQRRLAEYYLSSAGFVVATAADPISALADAKASVPDAIISDVLMPGMDGFQLCLAVRGEPRLAHVPVVLVSSHYVEEVDRRLAIKVGASTLVPRSEDLGAAMRAVLAALEQAEQPRPVDGAGQVREEMLSRTAAQLERQFRHNTRLGQQCLMQAAQLSVLAGVTDALTRSAAFGDALGDVLAACLDMAGISKGALYLGGEPRLAPPRWIGFSEAERRELSRRLDRAEVTSLLAQRRAVQLPSAGGARWEREFLDATGLTSALLVPVSWSERAYGVLLLGADSSDIGGAEPLAFARVLAAQIGQAIGLGEAFEKLQVSEEKFRAVSDAIDDRVIVLDLAHRVIGLYGRWTSKHGWQRHDILNHTIEEVLGGDPGGAHAAAHARGYAGESVVYEWSGEEQGEPRFVQTVVSPIRDSKGVVCAIVRVSRDVTEQKRTQAHLMTADRMATVGLLAASLAHEINNPLAVVTANLDLAEEDADRLASEHGEAPLAEAIGDAREGAARVRQIVQDLRIFSRAEVAGERVAVDVTRVLESSVRMAWNEIRYRARVVREFASVPPVASEESRLGQVFLNLIVNAAQAMPEGRADVNRIVLASGLDPSGMVYVEVRDTGSGMPPAVVKCLFTPFFTTKPAGVGTGLGLNICKRIVTELGGSISVDSQLGKGTTFRVMLPVSDQPLVAERVLQRHHVPAAARRGQILVVDDDVMICAAVTRALSEEHEIAVVMDARLALEKFRAGERYDAILCDLLMPVMTGMEFYRSLREMASDQAERVVFFSGAAFTASTREFLSEVKNPFIEKPFRVQRLRTVINQRVL